MPPDSEALAQELILKRYSPTEVGMYIWGGGEARRSGGVSSAQAPSSTGRSCRPAGRGAVGLGRLAGRPQWTFE
jgi:hypothetical protein